MNTENTIFVALQQLSTGRFFGTGIDTLNAVHDATDMLDPDVDLEELLRGDENTGFHIVQISTGLMRLICANGSNVAFAEADDGLCTIEEYEEIEALRSAT